MPTSFKRSPFLKAVAMAILIAGTLDISDALIFYGIRGVPPALLLKNIAYGLIGRTAFHHGISTAILGLLIHYCIATTVAVIYFLASLRLPLSRHPFLYGSLYGVAVYIVMNCVVLPLSRIGPRPTPPLAPLVNGVAALIFCIGIPIALIARHYLASPAGNP
jgi:uncharacterized membrane protein YagU involved in acid resistance